MEILVIGGGAAGMSAASWARRKAPEARITVLERTNIISHAPCGVPYYIGGLFKDYWLLQAYDVKFFRERRNIEVLTNAEAEELDSNLMACSTCSRTWSHTLLIRFLRRDRMS